MFTKIKWIIIFIVIIISYFIGNVFPITNLVPLIKKNSNSITEYQFWQLLINALLTVTTFCTVIVALLKDEIVSIWKKAKIEISETNDLFFKEKISEDNESPSAESYSLDLLISNKGTIEARNIKVSINKVSHENRESNISNIIEIKDRNVTIDQVDSQLLPPKTHFDFQIVNITTENKKSSGDASRSSMVHPKLYIGSNEISPEYHRGIILLEIFVYCDGIAPIQKNIKLQWDGIWKNRLTDFCPSHLKASFLNSMEN